MQDRVPLYPGRVKLTPVSGQTDLYDMERADQPTVEGTPLNKATFLTDAVAALYGLSGNTATINDVLSILTKAALLNSNESAITNMDGDELLTIPGVRIATGSYVGTGTYGADNPCTLTFDFAPQVVMLVMGEVNNGQTNYYANGGICTISLSSLPVDFQRYYGFCYDDQRKQYSYGKKSTDEKSISWYNTNSAAGQINSSDYTVYYLAIG